MQTYHTWTVSGKRYRAVYDKDYTPFGSYALDTPEETDAAEREEAEKLRSGAFVALGVIVSERKPHCPTCKCPPDAWPWMETDSLWGIVVENSTDAIEAFAHDCM